MGNQARETLRFGSVRLIESILEGFVGALMRLACQEVTCKSI